MIHLEYEQVIRSMAGVILQNAPVIGGVAILENQLHDTARLLALPREKIESAEDALLSEARALMPRMAFDLLIIDRIGKNISGEGIRSQRHWARHPRLLQQARARGTGHAIRPRYFLPRPNASDPRQRHRHRLADIRTTRLVHAMNQRATFINALTAMTPQSAKVPIYFDSDREVIEIAVTSIALPEPRSARIVRIAESEISEALAPEISFIVSATRRPAS